MGAYWQSDENATTNPSMSPKEAVHVAPIDALHAFSNETGKTGTHFSPSKDEACEGLSNSNNGRPSNSTHARESLDPEVKPLIDNASVDGALLSQPETCGSRFLQSN
jgi:hypothetical protein